jgi:hypothetical protein
MLNLIEMFRVSVEKSLKKKIKNFKSDKVVSYILETHEETINKIYKICNDRYSCTVLLFIL